MRIRCLTAGITHNAQFTMGVQGMRVRLNAAILSAVSVAIGSVLVALPAHAAGPRVDLRVLVVSDGQTQVSAVAAQLASEGVPVTTVDLTSASRPVITTAFLQDTVGGAPRAKFQAVVLPNQAPFTNQAELDALVAFETQFGIRQFDSYVYPNAAVGLNTPTYAGKADGFAATLSASAKAGAFRYLKGAVTFEDNSPTVDESYAFVGSALADDPTHGAHFEPYLTVTTPTGVTGSLLGVYTHDGRSELAGTFAYNSAQRQFRLLAHGIVTWLTKGIHFGYDRNYFAVHVDDIFLPNSRWSTTANCTPGEDCRDPATTTEDIRMIPADVSAAVKWEQQRGFTFDFLFNGGGSDEEVALRGSDPLLGYLQANTAKFRWVNHTYQHPFIGCIQDHTVVPWRCVTDASGAIQYTTKADIVFQINQNKTFATQKGLPIQPDEVVTGEHSGMRILPQQPLDNPNLGPALNDTATAWAGSDNSRDPAQRLLGTSTLTVPRHPMNVFFNVSTEEEEVDEYNWIYTSRADGGSGICEDNPLTTTCITPLDPATAYRSYIVPLETRIGFSHIVNNDPRPHYVHQSNLTEDRILYPVLNGILDTYNASFAASCPTVTLRLSAIGTELKREAAWKAAVAAGTVSGYLQDGKVTVTAPSTLDLPLTMPEGTKKGAAVWGEKYAGERSAWDKGASITLILPATSTV
jgi:hypothetical protein